MAWGQGRGKAIPLSENCPNMFLSENFRPKMCNLGSKISIIGKFRGKIEILITHKLLYQKFAVCLLEFLSSV